MLAKCFWGVGRLLFKAIDKEQSSFGIYFSVTRIYFSVTKIWSFLISHGLNLSYTDNSLYHLIKLTYMVLELKPNKFEVETI